jgi:hypothetical protein
MNWFQGNNKILCEFKPETSRDLCCWERGEHFFSIIVEHHTNRWWCNLVQNLKSLFSSLKKLTTYDVCVLRAHLHKCVRYVLLYFPHFLPSSQSCGYWGTIWHVMVKWFLSSAVCQQTTRCSLIYNVTTVQDLLLYSDEVIYNIKDVWYHILMFLELNLLK